MRDALPAVSALAVVLPGEVREVDDDSFGIELLDRDEEVGVVGAVEGDPQLQRGVPVISVSSANV